MQTLSSVPSTALPFQPSYSASLPFPSSSSSSRKPTNTAFVDMTDVKGARAAALEPLPDVVQASTLEAPTETTAVHDNGAATAAVDTSSASQTAKNIYLATYSNVSVYELMVRGIACMRRRSDGYINATQILKIAGIDKARRTKILEKEILTGEHEKVQGGYGKYQGTWIPLKRAQELSATYSVAHLLSPLLEFDPAKAGTVPVVGPRKRPNPNAPAQSIFYREGPGAAQLAAAKGAAASTKTTNGRTASTSSPSPAGPSQQPRFIFLRPPPGAPDDSTSTLNGSAADSANLVFPRGTSADQRQVLSGYATHGYMPQGVPLPPKSSASSADINGGALYSSDKTGKGSKAKRGAEDAFDESDDRDAKRSRGDSASTLVESGSAVLGPSPVKDLNALGRSTSPTSALRGARAPRRLHRIAVGPPEKFKQLQLDGTRFADRPQTLHEGDEGERRMRAKLLELFNEDKLALADVEAQTEVITKEDEKKLDTLLSELRQATQSGTEGEDEINGTLNTANGTGSAHNHIDMSAPPPCVDLVVDDHGHSALHWCSAMAKVAHVRMLVARAPSSGGANLFAGNYGGETPLHRTVLVTNAYETSLFPVLLHLLAPSLHTRDYRKQTVLHHIAEISGVRGRGVAARYYLACVLEYIARYQGGRYAALVDAQDEEGETALSIVARIGNVSMVKMLLDVGARKDLVNELGLKATDWGINGIDAGDENNTAASSTDATAAGKNKDKPSEVVTALQRPSRAPVQKSKDVLEQMTAVLTDLSDVFQKELSDKDEAFSVAQEHLQSATRELAVRRRQIAESQSHVAERDEARMRRQNLAKALKDELNILVQEEESDEDALIAQCLASDGDEADVSQDKMDVDTSVTNTGDDTSAKHAFAADAPFQQDKDDELVKLRWLEQWYTTNVERLQRRIDGLTEAGSAKMEQCRKVVAMCCGVPEDKVEGMLDELVLAIESIGTEGVDLQRLAGFLSKVKDPKA